MQGIVEIRIVRTGSAADDRELRYVVQGSRTLYRRKRQTRTYRAPQQLQIDQQKL